MRDEAPDTPETMRGGSHASRAFHMLSMIGGVGDDKYYTSRVA